MFSTGTLENQYFQNSSTYLLKNFISFVKIVLIETNCSHLYLESLSRHNSKRHDFWTKSILCICLNIRVKEKLCAKAIPNWKIENSWVWIFLAKKNEITWKFSKESFWWKIPIWEIKHKLKTDLKSNTECLCSKIGWKKNNWYKHNWYKHNWYRQ